MSKFQTFIKKKLFNLILVQQFLLLKWTKKSKSDINYVKPPPNYNNVVKIQNLIHLPI